MDGKDFRKEILEYIESAYDKFEESQKIITEMFSVFHDICSRNNFHYYYGFGSLLGIVRDGGMIPWDADIDVLVPINKMKTLINILKKELPSDYYIISNFIDQNYYLCESRICCMSYDPEFYHIDIFYLIGAPNDEQELLKFDKKVKKIYYRRALRYQKNEKGSTSKDKLVFFVKKGIKAILHIEPDFIFNRKCNRLLFKYEYNLSKNCIVWAVGGEIFPMEIFEPVKKYQDGEFECYLPHDADAFLKIRYSNYLEYLPIQNRFDEFYAGYKRFCKGEGGKQT